MLSEVDQDNRTDLGRIRAKENQTIRSNTENEVNKNTNVLCSDTHE